MVGVFSIAVTHVYYRQTRAFFACSENKKQADYHCSSSFDIVKTFSKNHTKNVKQ